MTYSQKYNPERYSSIQEIVDKVSSLRRGERLVVEGLERGELMRARGLLYDWFSHMGAKGRFRISMEWEGPRMVVRNMELGEGLRLSLRKGKALIEEWIEALIEAGVDEEGAKEKIAEWMREGKVNALEGAEILSGFSRVME